MAERLRPNHCYPFPSARNFIAFASWNKTSLDDAVLGLEPGARKGSGMSINLIPFTRYSLSILRFAGEKKYVYMVINREMVAYQSEDG